MQLGRIVGVSAVALGLFVGASGSALAGADSGGPVPYVGKDSGPAPAAVMPVGAGPSGAPASVGGGSKDSAGMAPSAVMPAGQAPASVAGLLSLGGGLVWQRQRR